MATTRNASNAIDNESLLNVNNEFHPHVFNSKGGWEGGDSSEFRNDTSELLDDSVFNRKVIKAYEFLLSNVSHVRNFTSVSESIKLLSTYNNSSNVPGNLSTDPNANNYEQLQIPDYIRTTSIIFCVVILCLGLIGNIMVNSRKHEFPNRNKTSLFEGAPRTKAISFWRKHLTIEIKLWKWNKILFYAINRKFG